MGGCPRLTVTVCCVRVGSILTVVLEAVEVTQLLVVQTCGSLVQAALTQPSSVSKNLGETIQITCSGLSSSYALAGSLVQAALTQLSSASANLGQTVQITCSGLSSSSSSAYVGWYQQKTPGSAPVTVIYESSKRPSDIPSRFSGSKSGTTGTLTITGVQAGSLVQAAITQPLSVSANLGQTVQVTCSGVSSGYVGWYQQKAPGSAPVTVIYHNTKRPLDIPSRFSGSVFGTTGRDKPWNQSSLVQAAMTQPSSVSANPGQTVQISCSGLHSSSSNWLRHIPSRFSGSLSGTTGTLTISGVQADDEAVYYCGGATTAAMLIGVMEALSSLVQAALTQQPSSVSANPGETVQITCSRSSNSYGWYQQKTPGSGPVTVIYWNDKRPSGIPSRFSGSFSGTTGALTITGV
ncbi:PREDICTED: uncharacterized protein LOC104372817 [Tauraco erythrolophus]|nr:PREDICTED: uncharacterized protein LOC104372817 [Tauraco erythrolophus]